MRRSLRRLRKAIEKILWGGGGGASFPKKANAKGDRKGSMGNTEVDHPPKGGEKVNGEERLGGLEEEKERKRKDSRRGSKGRGSHFANTKKRSRCDSPERSRARRKKSKTPPHNAASKKVGTCSAR